MDDNTTRSLTAQEVMDHYQRVGQAFAVLPDIEEENFGYVEHMLIEAAQQGLLAAMSSLAVLLELKGNVGEILKHLGEQE